MSSELINPYAAPPPDRSGAWQATTSFYALQPRLFGFDRFFKFTITPDGLYAAWIGGQFYDRLSVRLQLMCFYLLPPYIVWSGRLAESNIPGGCGTYLAVAFLAIFVLTELVALAVVRRSRRNEALADLTIPYLHSFLALDPRNYLMPRRKIQKILVTPEKNLWMFLANSGVIRISGEGGTQTFLVRRPRDLESLMRGLLAQEYPVNGRRISNIPIAETEES